jgi:hypothetical protein
MIFCPCPALCGRAGHLVGTLTHAIRQAISEGDQRGAARSSARTHPHPVGCPRFGGRRTGSPRRARRGDRSRNEEGCQAGALPLVRPLREAAAVTHDYAYSLSLRMTRSSGGRTRRNAK